MKATLTGNCKGLGECSPDIIRDMLSNRLAKSGIYRNGHWISRFRKLIAYCNI